MTTAIAAIRLLAASQVLFTALALAGSKNSALARLLGVILALGVMAYLSVPLIHGLVGTAGFFVAQVVSDAVPAALLLLVWVGFEDRNPPLWAWIVTAVYLGLVVAERVTAITLSDVAQLFKVVTQLVQLALAAVALFIVWRGREADLVELRLRLRRFFAAGVGVGVVAIVVTELVTGWHVPQTIELLGMTAILLLALVVNLAFLKLNPAFELGPPLVARPVVTETSDPLSRALTECMARDRVYADPDLRVGTLAARLRVPEYRLRRTINRKLGHRNFNQFVNGYRIAEAAERLRSQPHLPVLTIALDVGFSSLSSFNEAFRARKGCPPTVWRATPES